MNADALREAADIGWADIAAGRYVDVADEDLDEFLDGLRPNPVDRSAS